MHFIKRNREVGVHVGCIDDWMSDYDLELRRTFEEKTKLEDNEQDKGWFDSPGILPESRNTSTR